MMATMTAQMVSKTEKPKEYLARVLIIPPTSVDEVEAIQQAKQITQLKMVITSIAPKDSAIRHNDRRISNLFCVTTHLLVRYKLSTIYT